MSQGIVKSVITEFIDSTEPEVLAVSGRWGVGKTFALKSLVSQYKGRKSLKRFSYVSAFGAQSVAELRSTIFAKTRPLPVPAGEAGDAMTQVDRALGKGRFHAIWQGLKGMSELLPYGGKHIVIALETIATSLISKTLICIDDLERLSPAIRIEDLMGLVAELKEESQCKIILLFNEEQLGERSAGYQIASEKVVDKKLVFMTTPEDAAQIALPEETPLWIYAKPCVVNLDISNIRTVQKIAHALAIIHPVVRDFSESVQNQAAVAVVVFACALNECGAGFPRVELISKYNYFVDAMRDVRGDNGAEAEERISDEWVSRLGMCEFTSCDDFDRSVLKILEDGYIGGGEFEQLARALDRVADRNRLERVFSSPWDKFHDRADGTPGDLSDEFVAAVAEAAEVISPVNLNSTVRLVRQLGFPAKATAIIDAYIEKNAPLRPKVFDLSASPWQGEVNDPEVLRRFSEVLAAQVATLTLQGAADLLIANKEWSDEIIPTLHRAQADDFLSLLRNNQGPSLRSLISGVFRATRGARAEGDSIRLAFEAALAALEAESPLNAVRVARWRGL